MKPEKEQLKDAVTAGHSSGHWMEKWAALTPWLVICYFGVQLCVRLVIASPLEVDDAEMVGQIDWALGYPNSHPPLYHWLVRLCYDLFHSWPAATAFPKYALLAVAYLLVYHAARRASGSVITGAVAVAFFFFIPVVCWKTQTKLTHSILGFTATAALLHAVVCVLLRPGWKAFVWLGIAATIGLLAKYNFLVVLLSGVIAALVVGDADPAAPYLDSRTSTTDNRKSVSPAGRGRSAWVASQGRFDLGRADQLVRGDGHLGGADVSCLSRRGLHFSWRASGSRNR